MCSICAADKSHLARTYWAGKLTAHLQQNNAAEHAGAFLLATEPFELISLGKGYDAFPIDGVGDLKPVTTQNVLILTPDNVPGDTGTTVTVTVDGAHVVSTLNTIGDMDFFKVELVAGRTYDIGQYAKLLGPSGIPLADAYLELYDAAGHLIVNADGNGDTLSGQTYGLDAKLTYIPKESGTY